jgi:hypothetical protein
MLKHSHRFVAGLLGFGLAAVSAGCYGPGGGVMPYTGNAQVVYSTETRPMSMRVVDTRTDEVRFSMDIPVGQQLTYRFSEEGGDDPVLRPAALHWELMDIGTSFGRLGSAMGMPNRFSRRIDLYVRDGIEYLEAPPEYRLRADEEAERPGWWSPQGGPLPTSDSRVDMYDN